MKQKPHNIVLPISAYIICYNEELQIGDCIASLDFCSEIIIVDSRSTDRTIEIIEEFERRGYPVKLIQNSWPGYARQKQIALENCNSEWCLNIDADERVDDELKFALVEQLPKTGNDISALSFKRRDYLPGYGYAHPLVAHKYVGKLTRNGRARYIFDRLVHEELRIEGKIKQINKGYLLHDRDMPVFREAEKNIHYACLKAQERITNSCRPSVIKLLFSPPLTFIKYFIFKRYFLCGRAGVIYAGMFWLYSFATEASHYRQFIDKRKSRGA